MAGEDWGSLLGPDGPLASVLPGLERRPGQALMAQRVAAALEDGSRLAIEAGTGTGKTFAYLLPALSWAAHTGRRVVVSTWTRNLQEQIVDRDLPLLRRGFGLGVKVALVQGRQNYVCRRRAEEALERDPVRYGPPDRLRQHQELLGWAERSASGRRADLPFVPAAEVWAAARAESGKCRGERSPHFAACAWQWSRRGMREASVLVVNHALLLADLEGRRTGNPVLPEYQALVIDEAHHLEEVAAEHLGLRLSRAAVFARLREIEGWCWSADTRVGGMLDRVREIAQAFFARIEALLGARGSRRFLQRVPVDLELASALAALAACIDAAGQGGDGAPGAEDTDGEADAEELRSMALSIEQWARGEGPDTVVWAETSPTTGVMLCSAPSRPEEVLERELFDPVAAAVLTGASLRLPAPEGQDGFEHLRRGSGCRGAVGQVVESPFDFLRQARLRIDWGPEPGEEQAWEDHLARRLPEHLLRTRGRSFVLFTSRRTMERVAQRVREGLESSGVRLLVQGRRLPRHVLLERFREGPPAALFGLASFWEGVDVPGEALIQVILTRLPFSVPDHPLEEARAERLRAQGLDPFHAHSLPHAVLRWKQGFGRLIRSREDRGEVVVMDRRILTRRWGRAFLDALPPCPRFVLRDGEEWPLAGADEGFFER